MTPFTQQDALQQPKNVIIQAKSIREPIFNLIKKDYPEFDENSYITMAELNSYRKKHMEEYLVKSIGELSELDKKVIKNIEEHGFITDQIIKEDDTRKQTKTQIFTNNVVSFFGSWKFIICFLMFVLAWIIINHFFLEDNGFDPFPFILLNLIIACQAAAQVPLILMSQNRESEKDRERSKKDYMTNLNAELEIKMLHEKIDHLIMHQQQELLKIQQIQIDMITEISEKINSNMQ